MADKDSWWQDDARDSGEETSNPFKPRSTQNDAKSFEPRGVEEQTLPEFAEYKSSIKRTK